MKVYTSYYSQLKALDREGIIPIAISRTVPDWSLDRMNRNKNWLRTLAPRPEMHKMPMHLYIPRYEAILQAHDPASVCQLIKKMSDGQDAALLCWEKDSENCHRSIVAAWINKATGSHIEEYGTGEPNGDQQDLFGTDNLQGFEDI